MEPSKQNTKRINAYKKEHYCEIHVSLPKEYKAKVQLAAAITGCKSVAEYIRMCIDNTLGES